MRIRNAVFVWIRVLVAPLVCFTAAAQFLLGPVNGVISQTCPATVNAAPAGWVTATSGGSDLQALCYRATASCPNMPDLGVTYGEASPVGTSKGTGALCRATGGTTRTPGKLQKAGPF